MQAPSQVNIQAEAIVFGSSWLGLHPYKASIARMNLAVLFSGVAASRRLFEQDLYERMLEILKSLSKIHEKDILVHSSLMVWLYQFLSFTSSKSKIDQKQFTTHIRRFGNIILPTLLKEQSHTIPLLDLYVDENGIVDFPQHHTYIRIHSRNPIEYLSIKYSENILVFLLPVEQILFKITGKDFLQVNTSIENQRILEADIGTISIQVLRRVNIEGTLLQLRGVETYEAMKEGKISNTDPDPLMTKKLTEAAKVLKSYWPEGWQDVISFTDVVQPFNHDHIEGVFQNVVRKQLPGISFLSDRYWRGENSVEKLAEVLIHLAMHSKECYLLKRGRTVEKSALYFAPWRREYRPADSLFAGVLAFMSVCQWYVKLNQRIKDGWSDPFEGRINYERELAILIRDLQTGIAQLRFHQEEHYGLTSEGELVLSVVYDWWRSVKMDSYRLFGEMIDIKEDYSKQSSFSYS